MCQSWPYKMPNMCLRPGRTPLGELSQTLEFSIHFEKIKKKLSGYMRGNGYFGHAPNGK